VQRGGGAGPPVTRGGVSLQRLPEKAQVVGVERYTGDEILIAATRQARAILTRAEEVNFLSGRAGRRFARVAVRPSDSARLGWTEVPPYEWREL
jgi:hypothetical protein